MYMRGCIVHLCAQWTIIISEHTLMNLNLFRFSRTEGVSGGGWDQKVYEV